MLSPIRIVKGKVLKNENIAKDVFRLEVKAEKIPHEPGQFFMVSIFDRMTMKTKPYSVASASWEDHTALIIKLKNPGNVSKALCEAREHQEVELKGPYGRFKLEKDDTHKLLVATGAGYAPFRSIIRELFKQHFSGEGENTDKEITLLFGTKTKEEIIEFEELNKLAKEFKNFKYIVTLSREEEDHEHLKGRVTDHIHKVLTENQKVMICGSKEMTMDIKKILLDKNIPKEHIQHEIY